MMNIGASSWLFWSLLSAGFAALTAIFAKIGIEGIDSDMATFLRTIVIIAVLGAILAFSHKFQALPAISPR